MIGAVDTNGRALLEILVSDGQNGELTPVTAWIDTAFDGHLVFSMQLIRALELPTLAETEAILADGSKITLDTYLGFIEWFGKRMPFQVIANEGRFPLLGTGLLEQRVFHIDYVQKTLTVD